MKAAWKQCAGRESEGIPEVIPIGPAIEEQHMSGGSWLNRFIAKWPAEEEAFRKHTGDSNSAELGH